MKQAERAANRQRWQAEVEAWRTSGKPLSVWVRERNLSRDALEYWKRRIPAQRTRPAVSTYQLMAQKGRISEAARGAAGGNPGRGPWPAAGVSARRADRRKG